MKKIFTYLLILSIAVLASCKKDNNSTNNGTTIGSDTKVSPDNFNYATFNKVTINLTLKAPDNTPIRGAIVSVSLPDSAITSSPVFKGATDANGNVTGTANVPNQYTQLVISPNYAGLMNTAVANIHGGAITATIGGTTPFNGDIIAGGKPIPSGNLSAFSSKYKAEGVSSTDLMYPSPYTSSASATGTPKSAGVPLYLDPTNDNVSNAIVSSANSIFPENGNLPGAHPEFFNSSVVNVLNVIATTDVYVTYVGSGTSNYNSLAWYSYATNNPPTASTGGTNNNGIDKLTLIFPNAQASGNGGGLVTGNRVKIGTFNAGTTVAFCMIASGWISAQSNGSTVYGVNTSAQRYFSQDALNPESPASIQRHGVCLYDNTENEFLFGLEDANRQSYPSAGDFNDVMVYVKPSVAGAISTANIPFLPRPNDADGDGVPDSQDYFPNDPTRAYSVGSPLYTTAFEDNWPNKGDYDMNDLVTATSYALESNAQNQLVDMIIYTTVNAAGASFKDGYGIQLMGVPASKVSSVTGQQLISSYITLASTGVEANQTYATIIPFDNYNALINNPNGSFFINTVPGVPKVQSSLSTIKVTFTSPLPQGTFTGINPFIICNLKRGYEAHLAGYAPTDLVNKALFGTADDTSNPSTGRYYLSAINRPWALSFTGGFSYPVERADITTAYLHFGDWALGGGTSFTDWYTNTVSGYRNSANIYTK